MKPTPSIGKTYFHCFLFAARRTLKNAILNNVRIQVKELLTD